MALNASFGTAAAEGAVGPRVIAQAPSRTWGRTALTACVGTALTTEDLLTQNERHEEWLRQQYLRDLATLDRIEQQLADREPCFFAAMGELHALRGGDGA